MVYSEKSKNSIDSQPCPVCGGTQYEWGILNGTWYVKSWLSFNYKTVRVRRCLICNNLLHFVSEGSSVQIMILVFVVIGIIFTILSMMSYSAG